MYLFIYFVKFSYGLRLNLHHECKNIKTTATAANGVVHSGKGQEPCVIKTGSVLFYSYLDIALLITFDL